MMIRYYTQFFGRKQSIDKHRKNVYNSRFSYCLTICWRLAATEMKRMLNLQVKTCKMKKVFEVGNEKTFAGIGRYPVPCLWYPLLLIFFSDKNFDPITPLVKTDFGGIQSCDICSTYSFFPLCALRLFCQGRLQISEGLSTNIQRSF